MWNRTELPGIYHPGKLFGTAGLQRVCGYYGQLEVRFITYEL